MGGERRNKKLKRKKNNLKKDLTFLLPRKNQKKVKKKKLPLRLKKKSKVLLHPKIKSKRRSGSRYAPNE